jgi:hypothetical protein
MFIILVWFGECNGGSRWCEVAIRYNKTLRQRETDRELPWSFHHQIAPSLVPADLRTSTELLPLGTTGAPSIYWWFKTFWFTYHHYITIVGYISYESHPIFIGIYPISIVFLVLTGMLRWILGSLASSLKAARISRPSYSVGWIYGGYINPLAGFAYKPRSITGGCHFIARTCWKLKIFCGKDI